MRQKTVITKLLQSVTEVYYKLRQVLQSASGITKCDRLLLQSASGITKCDRLLLQSASGVTKCDSCYKVRRNSSLETLVHRRNVASQVFFVGITLVDVHLNLLNWFRFLILVGSPLVVLIHLNN